MATHVGALSHLVEAASALADMQPALLPHAGATAGRSSKNDSKSTAADSKREIFPERLLAILNDASLSEVVTWLPHGRSFVIIRPDVFAETVMPQYFPSADARTSSKYPSFTRKLNRWGFRQATRGPDTGAFHHPLFRRDEPRLCLNMVCQRSRANAKQSKAKLLLPVETAAHVKIAPLTKESLDTILPTTTSTGEAPKTEAAHVAAVSVSDDTGSEDSSGAATSNGSASSLPTLKRGISSDKEFVQRVLKDHEEMERLRIAKVVLYRAYIEALQGAQNGAV